jgi:tRNA nucleotidyltransferase/poly(A) polymerase
MENMIQLPVEVHTFMETIREHGYEVYVVGGAVRNLLLGLPVTNWDFTTNADPEKIQHIFPNTFYHNVYGTVTVKSDTHLFEITPYRKEGNYPDKRHPEQVVWATTLDEDLSRRDFTINAMAFDGEHIIDRYNGLADFDAHIVRTVGDPDTRFNEDALRLLRAIRFASQLGFMIEEKTRVSIQKNAGLIAHVSWERIRDELLKIIASEHPAEGILFLRSTGLLAYILPELDACFAVSQKSPKRHHIYDVGTHLVMALKSCPSSDVITRLATLLHDIGKVATYHKDETGLITFHNHEVVGTQQVSQIADRLRLSKAQKDKLVTLVQHHQFTVSEDQTDKAVRRFIRDVGKDYIQDMLDLRTGDRIGSGATPTSWRLDLFKKRIIEVQKEPFAVKDLKVNGLDVMSTLQLKPSKKVGDILDDLFKKVEEKTLENTREVLLRELETYRDRS